MDIKLAKNLEEKSALVNAALEEFLRVEPADALENLHGGVLYALGLDRPDAAARGKRIRPALCLIVCEELGGDLAKCLPFAMAVELMHNFFLVHDDIEDGDDFRRGRPSVWKRYGLAHGVNIGDYIFSKVFSALLSGGDGGLPAELRIALLQLLNETLDRTHIGQSLDLSALERDDITVEDYLKIVTNKTGYYLAAPMIGGAMIAGAPAGTIRAIREMGRCVGPVFQVVDDTIDLTRDKGRDSVGSDIREGKRSFLVAHTASRASEEDRRELFSILNLPREETTNECVNRALELFAKHGAVEAGRVFCEEKMARARQALAPAPENLRRTLTGIFEGLLDRKQ